MESSLTIFLFKNPIQEQGDAIPGQNSPRFGPENIPSWQGGL